MLFQNGESEPEEYYRLKDYHERQISYWDAQTNDKQKVVLELTTCMEMIKRLKQFWDITEGEDRKMLAHSLFDEIIYDLDNRHIADFRVKAWAEPFVLMRAALYEDEWGEELKDRFNSGLSSDVSFVSPNGVRTRVYTLKGCCPRPLDDGALTPKSLPVRHPSVKT